MAELITEFQYEIDRIPDTAVMTGDRNKALQLMHNC